MIEKCGRWIKFPSTPADVTEAKRRWQRKYTFPCAVCLIDCTHIKIKKPPFRVMNILIARDIIASMLATCNADEWFTSADASWPGSVHDSRIWSNSEICNIAKRVPEIECITFRR
nr:unnamed protein product [Callosobruchus chinensis]